ncbi:MAG: hypothetical protein ACXW5U_01640 [Thermoanaerobaculia bacterium]
MERLGGFQETRSRIDSMSRGAAPRPTGNGNVFIPPIGRFIRLVPLFIALFAAGTGSDRTLCKHKEPAK